MKIIVTGAAGFIGSNLTSKLLHEGHDVIGIDNLSFGSLSNMQNFSKNKKFTFIEKDVRDSNIFDHVKGDAIVHLASQKIPRYSNALRTLDDNSSMLKNVVKKCINDKIKIIYASSSDVYGKHPNLPYSEESDLVLGPTTVKRWSYALSKIYGEHYIIANNNEFDLEFTITRFFGSYGPNQNITWWGGPQSVFIQNILEGKKLEVHGDGLQTRTFTYIDDTIQGIMKCIFMENAKNEIFNVANEAHEEINMLGLANLIWEMMKGKDIAPDITLIPYETFGKYEDVRNRVPSIEKIKSMLGYIPSYSLKDGLKNAIDWQTKLYNSR